MEILSAKMRYHEYFFSPQIRDNIKNTSNMRLQPKTSYDCYVPCNFQFQFSMASYD